VSSSSEAGEGNRNLAEVSPAQVSSIYIPHSTAIQIEKVISYALVIKLSNVFTVLPPTWPLPQTILNLSHNQGKDHVEQKTNVVIKRRSGM
jgi:hypothetical protein